MLIPTPCSFGYISHQYRDTRERASALTTHKTLAHAYKQTDGPEQQQYNRAVRIHRLRAVCSFTHSFDWYVSRFLALCRSQSLFPSLAYIRCACKCVWVLCVLCGYIAKKYIEINDDETNETNERTNVRTRSWCGTQNTESRKKTHCKCTAFIYSSFVRFVSFGLCRTCGGSLFSAYIALQFYIDLYVAAIAIAVVVVDGIFRREHCAFALPRSLPFTVRVPLALSPAITCCCCCCLLLLLLLKIQKRFKELFLLPKYD